MRLFAVKFNLIAAIMLFSVLLINTGCAKIVRYPLPEEHADTAKPVGLEQVRDWGDTHSTYFQDDFIESAKQGRESYPEIYQGRETREEDDAGLCPPHQADGCAQ